MEPHEDDQAVFMALQRRFLHLARAIVVATLPLWVLVVPFETEPAWVIAELSSVLVYVAAFRSPPRLQARILVSTLIVLSAIGLLHFGPTLGTGLFLLACMLVAVFFLDSRGVAVTLLVLTLLLAAAVPLALSGTIVPVSFQPDRRTWFRIIATSATSFAALSFVFSVVLAQLRKALHAELEARRDARAAHAEREQALHAMEVSQRLENVGRLAAAGAHDINNALSVLQGSVELLDITSDPDQRDEVMREVQQGIRRIAATAKQLLLFSRQHTQTKGSCEPAQHVRALAQSLSRFMPANIVIEVDATHTDSIDLSPGAFEQLLLNLILNARDALPNGGRIQLSCATEHDRTVVAVTDTGVGMSDEVQARMFEPFFTTKGQHGTGLGLASVRSEVTKAGGEVAVDSAPGRGTTIRLYFPVRRRPAPQVPEMNGVLVPQSNVP